MHVFKLPEHYNTGNPTKSEQRRHEAMKVNDEDNRLTGFHNPLVEKEDYTTPVNKKDCLKMLDKAEAEASKESKKVYQDEYIKTKRYGSEAGTN